MTDNDKARDAAIQQIDKSLAGRPLSSFEHLLICRGWNACLAHAEARHAERVKALSRYASSLSDTFWADCRFSEDLPNLCRTHNYESCPVPIIKQTIEVYRGKHE